MGRAPPGGGSLTRASVIQHVLMSSAKLAGQLVGMVSLWNRRTHGHTVWASNRTLSRIWDGAAERKGSFFDLFRRLMMFVYAISCFDESFVAPEVVCSMFTTEHDHVLAVQGNS